MKSYCFSAPAKINLGLRIIKRRSDGYHELQSMMVYLPLQDELRITPLVADIEMVCHPAVSANQDENIVVKAVKAMQEAAGVAMGVRVELQKNIPVAAGLGGGSSDAATAMLALNHLFGLYWPKERLMEVGVRIGADVPFFIYGASAQVAGIGETLSVWQNPPEMSLLVINPGCALSTREVFSAYAQGWSQDGQGNATGLPPEEDVNPNGQQWYKRLINELEPFAIALRPEIKEVQEVLRNGAAWCTLMSGSGPSCFGIYENMAQVEAMVGHWQSQKPKWHFFKGEAIHRHPFEQEWQQQVV